MSALLDPNGSSTPQGGGGGFNYWALMCDWVLPSLERRHGPVKLVDYEEEEEDDEVDDDNEDDDEGSHSDAEDETKIDVEVAAKLKKNPSRRDDSDNQSTDSKQSHGSHDTAASAAAAQAKRDALIAKIAKVASRMDPHRAPPSLRPDRGHAGQSGNGNNGHSRGSQRSDIGGVGGSDASLDLYAFQAELEACLGLKLTLSRIDGLLRVFSARGDRRVDWADFVDWFWRIGGALAIADRKTEAQQQFIRVHSRNGERPRGSHGHEPESNSNSNTSSTVASSSPQHWLLCHLGLY